MFLSVLGIAVAVLTWQFPDLRLWEGVQDTEESPGVAEATAAAETPDPIPVTFDLADGAAVPRCAVFSGTAPQLDGRTLWFANAEVGGAFYVKEVDRHADGEWEIRTTVGADDSAGLQAAIYVFYVDEATSAFLQGLHGVALDDGPGYWYADALPPHLGEAAELAVERDGDPDSPACEGA